MAAMEMDMGMGTDVVVADTTMGGVEATTVAGIDQ
jgi:hypothetical protein